MTPVVTRSPAEGSRLLAALTHPVGGAVVYGFVVLIVTGLVRPHALLAALESLPLAVLILGAPALGGVCWVPRHLRERLETRWLVLLSAGLGIGGTSLLVLASGLVGVLDRRLWGFVLTAMVVGGTWTARRTFMNRRRVGVSVTSPSARVGRSAALWTFTLPFAVLSLIAAAHAPGFLWAEEGYGYDALEYHLQMPREYVENGSIGYAPHNVYANFPSNVEMLYLLGYVLCPDELRAAELSLYLHLLLGVMTVVAAWLAGKEVCPAGGVVAGTLTASTGWLTYFCGLAYVENGLLFFGLMSLTCLLRANRGAANEARPEDSRFFVFLGGVFSGLACGCKYTAVPMILIPLTAVAYIASAKPLRKRIQECLGYVAVSVAVWSPWLVKNAAWTGNPVFPLANGLFQAYPPGWTQDSQRRWDEGHAPAAQERTGPARASALVSRVFLDEHQRMGAGTWMVAGLGLFAGLIGGGVDRKRRVGALAAMLLLQVAVWLGWTHLYARFAVVFLIPLAACAANSVSVSEGRRTIQVAGYALLAVSCVVNAGFLLRLARDEFIPQIGRGRAAWIAEGLLPGYEYMRRVKELPPVSRILLVGDAKALYYPRSVGYAAVFNEHPLGRIIREAKSDEEVLIRLREQGWTHVLVHWREMSRLRRSRYGFDPDLTEAVFDRLEKAGLRRVESFPLAGDHQPYVDLYEVHAGMPRF